MARIFSIVAILVATFFININDSEAQLTRSSAQATCDAYRLFLQAVVVPGLDPVQFCRAYNGNGCGYANNMGQAICRIMNGDGCGYANEIGQGICRAANGSGCGYVESLGQGLCSALGGSGCGYADNIGSGLCRGLGGSSCTMSSSTEILKWVARFHTLCEL